jgi:hypothetical protein
METVISKHALANLYVFLTVLGLALGHSGFQAARAMTASLRHDSFFGGAVESQFLQSIRDYKFQLHTVQLHRSDRLQVQTARLRLESDQSAFLKAQNDTFWLVQQEIDDAPQWELRMYGGVSIFFVGLSLWYLKLQRWIDLEHSAKAQQALAVAQIMQIGARQAARRRRRRSR